MHFPPTHRFTPRWPATSLVRSQRTAQIGQTPNNLVGWTSHRATGGKVRDRTYEYTFCRDENGKLSSTGTYEKSSLAKASFKFPKQARFSFGVASVLPTGGTESIGKRIEIFDYTGRKICTREVFEKHMKDEMNRVKQLKGECLPWYVDPRPKDEV